MMLLNLNNDKAIKIEDISTITAYIDDRYLSPKCVALDINGSRFMEKKLSVDEDVEEVLNQFKVLLRDIISINKNTDSYKATLYHSIEWLDDDHKDEHYNRYYVKRYYD